MSEKKIKNLNQKVVNYFNHFFATTGENLNKKFRQSECSLKNQQVQSMLSYQRAKKGLKLSRSLSQNTAKTIWILTISL